MEHVQVRVYFDITKKGRGKRAQALLQLLRERAQQAKYGSITVEGDAAFGGNLYFHTIDTEPGVVYHDIGWANEGKLPGRLAILKPLRVVMTASGHFNFPTEGIYEEGNAEVSWSLEIHNAYDLDKTTITERSWSLTLATLTIEEAHDLLQRIRTGEAPLKHQWVNRLDTAQLQETGEASPERAGIEFDDLGTAQH